MVFCILLVDISVIKSYATANNPSVTIFIHSSFSIYVSEYSWKKDCYIKGYVYFLLQNLLPVAVQFALPRLAALGECVWGVARVVAVTGRDYSNDAGWDVWTIFAFTVPHRKIPVTASFHSQLHLIPSYILLPAEMVGLRGKDHAIFSHTLKSCAP